jgi:hypothetical protein
MIDSFLYWFEYVMGYIMTKPSSLPYYRRYMWEKYGTRYCTEEQFDEYWREQTDHTGISP